MSSGNRWLIIAAVFFSVLCAGLWASSVDKITVMNPRGIMPPIKQIPMAERPGSLDGKTIYIVDTKFANTKAFVTALRDNLAAAYPTTTWIGVDKTGSYMVDDPKLWAEIKTKGSGAIVLLGH